MPTRPIDIIRMVCDFIERNEQGRDVVSKQTIMLAFSTYVSLDPTVIKKYLELGRQLNIWAEQQDGQWKINYGRVYDFGG